MIFVICMRNLKSPGIKNLGLEIMNALLIFITMCKEASVADNRVEQSIQGVGTEVLRPKI